MFHTGYIQCTGDVFVTAVCALKTPLTDQPNLNKATHFYFYPYIHCMCKLVAGYKYGCVIQCSSIHVSAIKKLSNVLTAGWL